MRVGGPLLERTIGCFNSGVLTLAASPRWGHPVRGYITTVTYSGRRSGRTFRTPVAYRRTGDVVTIDVLIPDSKTWWRNFTESGGPVWLHLDGTDRYGQAIARRDDRGRVSDTVRLTDSPSPMPPI